jgi:hypothetical protein
MHSFQIVSSLRRAACPFQLLELMALAISLLTRCGCFVMCSECYCLQLHVRAQVNVVAMYHWHVVHAM